MINELIKKLNIAATLTSQEEKDLANAITSSDNKFNLSKEVFDCYYGMKKTPQTSLMMKAIYTKEVLLSLTPNELIFIYENLTAIKEYNSPIYFFMTEIALLQEVALSTKDKLGDKLINIILDTILVLSITLKEECKDLLWDVIDKQWFIDIIKDGVTDATREKLFDLAVNSKDTEILKRLKLNSITIDDMEISSFYIFFPNNTFFDKNKLKDNTGNFTYHDSRLINEMMVIDILSSLDYNSNQDIYNSLLNNLILSSELLVIKTYYAMTSRLKKSNLLVAVRYLFVTNCRIIINEIIKDSKINYELLDYLIYDNDNYNYRNYIIKTCSENIKNIQMFNYILKKSHPFDETFNLLCKWVLTTSLIDEDKRNYYLERICLVHRIIVKEL